MALRRLLVLLCCKIALADKDPSAGSPQLNAFWVAALQWWCETMDNEADPRCNLLFTHRHISATSDGTQIRGLSRQLNDNLPRTAAQQQKMFETMVTQFCEKAAAPPRECGRQSAWMQPIVRGSAPLGGGAFAHAASAPTPAARPRVDAAGRPMPELHAGAHAHDRVAAMAAAKERQRPPPGSLAAAAEHPHPLRAAGAMAHAGAMGEHHPLRPRDASVAAADAAAHLRASGVVSGGGGGGGGDGPSMMISLRALSSECHSAAAPSSAACESLRALLPHLKPALKKYCADALALHGEDAAACEAHRVRAEFALVDKLLDGSGGAAAVAAAAGAGAGGGGSSDSALLALVVLCAVAAAALGLWRSPTAQARLLGHPLVLQLFSRKRGVRREADRVARTFGFGTADAEESLDAKDVA